MYLSHRARVLFRVFAALVLFVLYFPLVYVARLSVNTGVNYVWPPKGWTLEWWEAAIQAPGPREALLHSVKTALWATSVMSDSSIPTRWNADRSAIPVTMPGSAIGSTMARLTEP